MISFDNTEYAFAYKTTKALKKANFLFSTMGKPWLVNLGLKLMPAAIKLHIPFTKTIIRNTIFSQFVGGETLEETATVGDKHVIEPLAVAVGETAPLDKVTVVLTTALQPPAVTVQVYTPATVAVADDKLVGPEIPGPDHA